MLLETSAVSDAAERKSEKELSLVVQWSGSVLGKSFQQWDSGLQVWDNIKCLEHNR